MIVDCTYDLIIYCYGAREADCIYYLISYYPPDLSNHLCSLTDK